VGKARPWNAWSVGRGCGEIKRDREGTRDIASKSELCF
jgi:hypothetical protein